VTQPPPTLTLLQHKDAIGDPIVLLQAWNPTTRKLDSLTDRDMPPAAVVVILAFLNAHIATAVVTV
jgi:hypothetical protein